LGAADPHDRVGDLDEQAGDDDLAELEVGGAPLFSTGSGLGDRDNVLADVCWESGPDIMVSPPSAPVSTND